MMFVNVDKNLANWNADGRMFKLKPITYQQMQQPT